MYGSEHAVVELSELSSSSDSRFREAKASRLAGAKAKKCTEYISSTRGMMNGMGS